MSDQELSKKIEDYQKLAKENPKIDLNLLMMNALKEESVKGKSSKSYRWPYLISIGLPPFGLIYAVKYYFSEDDNDKQAAKICALLTAVAVILFFVFGKLLFSSAGVTPSQIEQIKPKDIYQLTQ